MSRTNGVILRKGKRHTLETCLGIAFLLSGCGKPYPPDVKCPAHLELPAETGVSVASVVGVGTDFSEACTGTIVHLDETTAWVLTARHCFGPKGRPLVPLSRVRIYFALEDAEGRYWEPRPAERVVLATGPEPKTLRSEGDNEYYEHDWAFVVVRRDPSMKAVDLADALPKFDTEVRLATLRPQSEDARPCPHAHTFAWGSAARIMEGGYSGASIVSDGKVIAVFVGGAEGRFGGVKKLIFVPVTSLPRPWNP